MRNEEKLEKMIKEFSSMGIKENLYAPPIYKAMWKWGINMPPPLFSSLCLLFLFHASIFIAGFILVMQILYFLFGWEYKIIILVFIGILCGLIVALYYRGKAKKMHLPFWKIYGEE